MDETVVYVRVWEKKELLLYCWEWGNCLEMGESSCCGRAYGWRLGYVKVAMRKQENQCNEGEKKEPVNFVILIKKRNRSRTHRNLFLSSFCHSFIHLALLKSVTKRVIITMVRLMIIIVARYNNFCFLWLKYSKISCNPLHSILFTSSKPPILSFQSFVISYCNISLCPLYSILFTIYL